MVPVDNDQVFVCANGWVATKHDDGQIIYWRAPVLHREGDTFIGSTAEASRAVREHFGDSITFGPQHIARNVTTQGAA